MAIRALMYAYADAVNRRDPEGMAAVLTSDAIIEKPGHGEPVQGVEKIRKRYQRLQRERRFLCQLLQGGVVQVEGDRATARWWFSETKLPVADDRWLTMIGVYQDELVRLPEGWRFSRRVQTTIMETALPADAAIAMHDLPAFSPILQSTGS
jgi:hypothetical protein